INRIAQRHEKDNLDVVKLEPLERHGFYGWLARSFIPGLKASVKPVDLGGCELLYLIAPKWGYNCPPVNGFIGSHDLKGMSIILIVTYTKGNISGYVPRLARRIRGRGADLLGTIALKREEILSEALTTRLRTFLDEVAPSLKEGSADSHHYHHHEIVFIGMINVNRDDYLQGVVDVRRCRQCRKLFCEDRRYSEGLKPDVGFEEIPDDEQWAILTCTDIKGVFMQSLPVKPGKRLEHTCKSGEKHEFTIGDDWSIDSGEGDTVHRLYMVRDYLNRVIEAGYYKLRLLK
ncbi:MAG: hypothetical protein HYU03_04250, partial [Thaumarchaeota archaeon]|nr:hypothetical protein [Nitrososphaerota archaeon]